MKHTIYSLLLVALALSISSCSFTQKIKDGETAYELRQYAIAVDLLSDEYLSTNTASIQARLAFLLGESYRKMGNSAEALPWFQKAVKHDFGILALEKEAESLKSLERYKEAMMVYQNLEQSGTSNRSYSRDISICRLAADWKANEAQAKYKVETVAFNSPQSDYSPVLVGGKSLFFSSDRGSVDEENTYKWTGRNYSDIYVYQLQENSLQKFDPIINTDDNEGTLSFSNDGSSLFFTRCFAEEGEDEYCKIMLSNYSNGEWSKAKLLPFVEDNVNYGHPFWSEKDSVLFFSSEIEGGYGGFDLYFTQLDSLGTWSRPYSMGPVVNTQGDEKFPVIKQDTLFFASDGHPGMGGLDLFYSYLDSNNRWVTPFNMRSPINSGGDDFSISFAENPKPNGVMAYFSSSRHGSDDIYTITKRKIVKPPVEDPSEEILNSESSLFLAVSILLRDENGNTRPAQDVNLFLNQAKIDKNLNDRGFLVQSIASDNYEVEARKSGYFTQSKSLVSSELDIPEGKQQFTYNVTIVLDPIIADKEIEIDNIFYDFNEYAIREDARPALNDLTDLLIKNPTIVIELSSHTDCRGNNDFNQVLSQNRAQAAVDYIIQRGIDSNRIQAKGYGESVPSVNCACDDCSEDEHQANRRTTFKVIKQ